MTWIARDWPKLADVLRPRSLVLLLVLAGTLLGAAPAAAAPPPVRISELHYDDAGADEGEAIEVEGPAGTDLSGWSLVLYNGTGGAPYGTRTLSGTIPDQAGGRGTVSVDYPANGIQNGSPDGVALIRGTEVVELLSYEGQLTAAGGPADGRTSTDVGVAETTETPEGQSLQRAADGTWSGPAAASFGRVNGTAGPVEPEDPLPPATCDAAATTIPAVQGAGARSPRTGENVAVQGTVVGDFQGLPVGLGGVFVQDPAGDGDPATSDGVFVYGQPTPDVAVGDRVRAVGRVTEFARSGAGDGTLTEIVDASLTPCGAGTMPAPARLSLPADEAAREPLEGMLVRAAQPLSLTETFRLDDFGEARLSVGGTLTTPTEVAAPGEEARALAAENARRAIVLDDGSSASAPRPVPYLGAPRDPTRRGDRVTDLEGVLGFDFGEFRVHPTRSTAFERREARPRRAPRVGGDVRIGNANVLNYFLTLGERGAETEEARRRQREKIVSSLVGLDADVITLQEIESDGGRTLRELVDALNARAGRGTFAAVPVPANFSGTDQITVAQVYRPDRVRRVGASKALPDPAFAMARQPIAQTFQTVPPQRGPRTTERFTVVANHFKSKGCGGATGADADQGDGQSCFNASRVRQARALGRWIFDLQDAARDDDVLALGDLNSYGREEPLDELRLAGLRDQLERFPSEADRYSYVFDGQAGALDHAFATRTAASKVTGAGVWHTNAAEADAFAYDAVPELFRPDAFRASDHDPSVLGLRIGR